MKPRTRARTHPYRAGLNIEEIGIRGLWLVQQEEGVEQEDRRLQGWRARTGGEGQDRQDRQDSQDRTQTGQPDSEHQLTGRQDTWKPTFSS